MLGFCQKRYPLLVAQHARIQCRQALSFSISNDLRIVEHVRPFIAVAALEEIAEPEKKERLSRKECSPIIESFVNSHRASNGCNFPSVSLIAKTKGCSQQTAKKIADQLLLKGLNFDVEHVPLAAQESTGTSELNVTFCGNSEEHSDSVIDQFHSGASTTSEVKIASCGKSLDKDDSEIDQSTSVANTQEWVGKMVTVEDRPAVKSMQEQCDQSISSKNESVTKSENVLKRGRSVIPPKAPKKRTFASRRMIESAGKEIQNIFSISEQIRAIEFPVSNPSSQHQAPISAQLERHSKLQASQSKFSSPKQLGNMSGSVEGTFYQLVVGNLDSTTTDEELRDSFQNCGAILKASVFHKKSLNGKPWMSFGLVYFKTQDGLNKALQKEKPKIKGREVGLLPGTSVRNLNESFSSKVNEKQSATENPVPFSSVECSAKSEPVTNSVPQTLIKSENSKYAVLVENLPAGFSTFQVKEALSRHGEVTGFYTGSGGRFFIEFKNEEDMENALALPQVYIAGHLARIRRISPPNNTVIRISNVSPDTKMSSIYSLCKFYGDVRTVKVKKGGEVDIHFESSEITNMLEILNRLNEVTVDQTSWRARPAPIFTLETFRSCQTREKDEKFLLLKRKLGSNLRDLVIDFEDLIELHSDFLHYSESA